MKAVTTPEATFYVLDIAETFEGSGALRTFVNAGPLRTRRGSGRLLILVRHAMPEFSPEVPPGDWPLSAAGRAAAVGVAAWVAAEASDAVLMASTEVKAVETLAGAGEVRQDARFDEVGRVEPFGGEFRRLRREYVGGVEHAGWEPHARVVERFDAAVRAYGDGRPLVVATHGMALTLWLTARIGLDDPGAFWADLRFPDVLRVDVAARRVERVELAGWSS